MLATASAFGDTIDGFVSGGSVLMAGVIAVGAIGLGWKIGSRIVSKFMK